MAGYNSSQVKTVMRWALSYRSAKRIFDTLVAASALVLGAPLAFLIAVAIRLSCPGPLFFSQTRNGERGRPFTIYKFRTLPVAAANEPERWVDVAPPEAGVVGRFLRVTGLDEWPQFWNVLRGEMSVVGPRPERPKFSARFKKQIHGYCQRQSAPPGITGWAQIHGLRGDSDIRERLAFDLYYLENCGFWLDCKIVLLTPLSALRLNRPATLKKDHARSV